MQDQKIDTKSVSFCPSFNSYSTDNQLADVAARVSEEQEQDDDAAALLRNGNDNNNDDEDDDDFEFVLLRKNPNDDDDALKMYGTGDQDDHRGYMYPIFNRDLLLLDDFGEDSVEDSIRLPLKNLFIDTRQDSSSSSLSSSSEADELEGIPSGTYCLWTPKPPSSSSSPSPGRCKKSNSTGSSSTSTSSKQKRWRLRDLLRRCKSIDGNESLVFLRNPVKPSLDPKPQASCLLTSPNRFGNNLERSNKIKKAEEIKGKSDVSTVKIKRSKEKMGSAHEVFYVRRKSMKDEDKRKSYLPYRQDLVGFFANVNGLGRTFTPF